MFSKRHVGDLCMSQFVVPCSIREGVISFLTGTGPLNSVFDQEYLSQCADRFAILESTFCPEAYAEVKCLSSHVHYGVESYLQERFETTAQWDCIANVAKCVARARVCRLVYFPVYGVSYRAPATRTIVLLVCLYSQ
jgi:hypothetical protein